MSKNKISKIKKINTISFRPKKRRESKYALVFEEMEKLKKDECYIIDVPQDVLAATYIRRLNAVQRAFLEAKSHALPQGCVFKKRVTEDGNVAVCCVEKKGKP